MVHSVVKDKSYPHIWNQIEPRDHELKATNVAPGAMTAGGVTLVMKSRGHDRFYFCLYLDVLILSLLFFFTKALQEIWPHLHHSYGTKEGGGAFWLWDGERCPY